MISGFLYCFCHQFWVTLNSQELSFLTCKMKWFQQMTGLPLMFPDFKSPNVNYLRGSIECYRVLFCYKPALNQYIYYILGCRFTTQMHRESLISLFPLLFLGSITLNNAGCLFCITIAQTLQPSPPSKHFFLPDVCSQWGRNIQDLMVSGKLGLCHLFVLSSFSSDFRVPFLPASCSPW